MQVNCINCGKEMDITLTRYNKSLTKEFCCSRECRSQYKINSNLNYNCDSCGKPIHIKPSHLNKSKTHCCSVECSASLKSKKYKGDNNPNYGNRKQLSPLWKGDKVIVDDYVYVYVGESHPFSVMNGRIREHRLLAEKYLMEDWQSVTINGNKYLSPQFEVHHVNHKKDDNRLENLMIVTKEEHMRIHQEDRHKQGIYRKLVPCPICGREFDKNDYYRLNNKKTCSDKCLSIYEEQKQVEQKISKTKNCPQCHKEFLPSNKNSVCCSMECSKKLRGVGSSIVGCGYCGKEFKIKNSRLKKSDKVYCCRECYTKDRNSTK